MENPWKEVALSDYESHMALSDVLQLQTLDRIMREQFSAYPVKSVAILGVAGGNGLGNLIDMPAVESIYGIDINSAYLTASAERYPQLTGRYKPILADINEDYSKLPDTELVVANLFIEYVGCKNFAEAVQSMHPRYVSCVIQIDPAESFVSESPYTEKLEVLDSVHNAVNEDILVRTMNEIGYDNVARSSTSLPNGKIFHRLDFSR